MKFLNNITEEEFLNIYWEKKPFVIRNAISHPESLVEVDDLMTMACDEDYETRLISKSIDWEVKTGPFQRDQFEDKQSFWTLIVHNMNLYFEKIQELEKQVEFIPKWLFDDVMCTYSTKGSSVGAHIDSYNVFILQTNGKRKWSIQEQPKTEYQEGIEVKILKEFNAENEFILEPGDMIYIPPHVAHWGESLTESCSLSIGFKSVPDKDILDLFCLGLIHQEDVTNDFYRTKFKTSQRNSPYEVTQDVIDDLYEKLKQNIDQRNILEEFITKELSTPKKDFEANELSFEEFCDNLEALNLYKDEFTRGVYRVKDERYIYGINAINFNCNKEQASALEKLLSQSHQEPIAKDSTPLIKDFLYELYIQGSLYFSED